MSPVLAGGASTQLRFTVQGPPSPPVLDMLVPASGLDMLVDPPASGVFWGLPLVGALASLSLLFAAMPFATALASSEEAPLSAAAPGATDASSPWFPVPAPKLGAARGLGTSCGERRAEQSGKRVARRRQGRHGDTSTRLSHALMM